MKCFIYTMLVNSAVKKNEVVIFIGKEIAVLSKISYAWKHTFNSSRGRQISVSLGQATGQVLGRPGIHRESACVCVGGGGRCSYMFSLIQRV